MLECDVTVFVYYNRLKCQLSGDALQDSRSPINSIKSRVFCVIDPNPISVTYG